MYTIQKVTPVFSALDFEQCPWYCVPAFPTFPLIVSWLTEAEEESVRVVPVLCWSQHISFPHKTAYCVLCDQTKYPRNSQSVHKTCTILTFNSKPFFFRFNKFEENSVKLDGTKEKLWDIQEFENFRVKHTKKRLLGLMNGFDRPIF